MFPVCFLPKQETDGKEKRLSWSRWKLRRKDVWIRGCVSVPRPTEQRQADIYRRGVMRQRAGQFSAVCDRHVLLVLVRPLNLELKALEEGGCGFLDAFVCIQIITVTNVLFCCFCNFLKKAFFFFFFNGLWRRAWLDLDVDVTERDLPQGPPSINKTPPRKQKDRVRTSWKTEIYGERMRAL